MFNWSKSSKGPSAAPAAAHGDAPVFRDIGDLKGQVAVISGSTSGIGLALARAVAARGGDVVLNGLGDPAEIERTRAGLEAGSSGRVRYHAANMMRGDEIADMVAFAKHEFGRLDILVNNAGIQHVESVEKFPTDKWEQIIAINLSSAFYATRAAIPIMKAQGRGRIVNMASAHGLVASPFKSAYVAAKHGNWPRTISPATPSAPASSRPPSSRNRSPTRPAPAASPRNRSCTTSSWPPSRPRNS